MSVCEESKGLMDMAAGSSCSADESSGGSQYGATVMNSNSVDSIVMTPVHSNTATSSSSSSEDECMNDEDNTHRRLVSSSDNVAETTHSTT